MIEATARLVLSAEDRARVAQVETFARDGSVAKLLVLLSDPSWAVRRAVVSSLANVGEPAIEGLLDVLEHHRDSEARLAAAVDALVGSRASIDERMMKLAESAAESAIVCDAVQVLGRRRVHAAVPLLAKLSLHADDNVAVASIEGLGRIGGVATVDALITAIEGRHFFRAFPAIDALGRTADTRAVAPLTALLADPLYAPEAIRALGRTGQGTAVAPLAQLLPRSPAAVVRTAVGALAELRERYEARFGDTASIASELPSSIDPLVASAKVVEAAPGAVPSELVATARVLGWLGDDHSIANLIEMVSIEAPVGPAATDALRRLGPRATPSLLARLHDADSTLRLALLPIVGYAAGSIDELIACLRDTEAQVRVRAAEALSRLGNPAAVAELFKLIGDRDAAVSQAAAAAIQSLGSLETKRLALEQARTDDPRTRRAALRIISYFGYAEGIDVLIAAMNDEDDKTREAAINGLPLIDDPRGTTALLHAATHVSPRTRATVMRALGQTEASTEVVLALRRGLADEDPWARYYACQSLGRLAVEGAVADIVALVDDASGQVSVGAVDALARLKSPEAAAALASAATSSNPDKRRAAIVGLGIARRPASVPLLRSAATADDAATRLVAIGALAEYDTSDVVPSLAHAATDPDESVRSAAIGYLSTRPGPDATAVLVSLLDDPALRDRAIDAIAVAADQRVEAVLAALETAGADRATVLVAALSRMRRASGQAALGAALTFENVYARRAAASALAALGTPEARAALERAESADPDPAVRRLCATVTRPRERT